MEYATQISSDICDYNLIKFVGWKQASASYSEQKLFSPETIKTISCKVTELLMGVDPQNRPIIVPDKTICSVLSNIYTNYRPETEDIYSRYNIPTNSSKNLAQNIIDQTINVIVNDVKINIGMVECNKKLSVWTTVLGDFNEKGLRSHSPIKLREKRPAPMLFMMNY